MVNYLVNTCQGEILASCFLTPRVVQQSPYSLLLAMVVSQDNDTCLDPCRCEYFIRVLAFERANAQIVHAFETALVHITKLRRCNSGDSLGYDIAQPG
jgi:hypothetical protein